MNVWMDVLYIAAAIASILAFFYGIYANGKGKRWAGIGLALFFALSVVVVIFNRDHLSVLLHAAGSAGPIGSQPVPMNPSPKVGTKDFDLAASADINKLRGHFIDVQVRVAAMEERWRPIIDRLKAINQPLRGDITTALGRLRSYTDQAQQALNTGDADGVKHDLDVAEKQLTFLERQNPE
jgi:hypothetical protein